jgi:hypothetical protein
MFTDGAAVMIHRCRERAIISAVVIISPRCIYRYSPFSSGGGAYNSAHAQRPPTRQQRAMRRFSSAAPRDERYHALMPYVENILHDELRCVGAIC